MFLCVQKNLTMRLCLPDSPLWRRCLLAFAACALLSCSFLSESFSLGRGRNTLERKEPEASLPDTTVLLAAALFPSEGDAEIALYEFDGKDFNLTRTFSPSAYPGLDVHTGNFHIWNGGLLFQTFNEGRTEVYLSGDKLVSFGGKETLLGIVDNPDGLYTLSTSGRGFSLRRDGEAILVNGSGEVFGSLDDVSYPDSGALIEDRGSISFCYSRDEGDLQYIYRVTDGMESTPSIHIDYNRVVDAKMINSVYHYALTLVGGRPMQDQRLWRAPDGGIAVSGYYLPEDMPKGRSLVYLGDATNPKTLVVGEFRGTVCYSPQGSYAVSGYSSSAVRFSYLPPSSERSEKRYPGFFLESEACLYFEDGLLLCAMSSSDSSSVCVLSCDGPDFTEHTIPLPVPSLGLCAGLRVNRPR